MALGLNTKNTSVATPSRISHAPKIKDHKYIYFL